jgi:nucleoside-diphosphate-sugar epimerase
MARIAVVGATGQIGAEVVRLLVGGGHEVRALVRDAGHAQTTLSDGIDLLEGDMRDSARHARSCPTPTRSSSSRATRASSRRSSCRPGARASRWS